MDQTVKITLEASEKDRKGPVVFCNEEGKRTFKTLESHLRYSHLAPNHKTRAINILDGVMSQNPPNPISPRRSWR